MSSGHTSAALHLPYSNAGAGLLNCTMCTWCHRMQVAKGQDTLVAGGKLGRPLLSQSNHHAIPPELGLADDGTHDEQRRWPRIHTVDVRRLRRPSLPPSNGAWVRRNIHFGSPDLCCVCPSAGLDTELTTAFTQTHGDACALQRRPPGPPSTAIARTLNAKTPQAGNPQRTATRGPGLRERPCSI